MAKVKGKGAWAFLTISASQLNTWRACKRKWLFLKLYRLPVVRHGYFVFGERLHECAERFLKGEETFPKDWEEGISSHEARLITKLIEIGIGQGILVPAPGNLIEQDFERKVIKDVDIMGYIDVLNLENRRIEDHKSAKNTRYTLTPQTLGSDTQMLTYARSMVSSPSDDDVNLVHNQFIKDLDNPRVRRVETQVTAKEVLEHWARVEQDAKEMRDLKRKYFASGNDRSYPYSSVEMGSSKACNAYGGCSFAGICGGREQVPNYVRKIARINNAKENGIMGMFSDMKKGAVDAPVEKQEEAKKFDCAACEDTQKNSKGGSCKSCAPGEITNKSAPQEEAKEATQEEKKTRKGRKPGAVQRPTLAIGAIASGRGVTPLHEVFAKARAIIEEDLGTEYLALDPFKRRDMLEGALAKMELPRGVIFGSTETPELKALVAALRPLCGTVIQGVS